MLREISEDVRVRLKDRLRDLRSKVREHRHDHARSGGAATEAGQQPFPVREIEGILGHAVSAFDDVMTFAERLAPSRDPGGSLIFAPRPLQAYFRLPEAGLDGARAFRRDLYRLAKLALEQKKLAGFRIRESDFASVHEALQRSDAVAIARLHSEANSEDRLLLVAGLTARLFVELVRQEPIRLATSAEEEASVPPDLAAAVNALAAIAIACGLATLDLEGAPGRELMEIATLAVDVRGERIDAALDMDRLDELTRLFESLLAHLN
ncbi:MAG: hypothetical protein NTV73_06350 [Hyphomicrobiales bacterium]|nr:hypothetical protein [Hyphomicrobiales bacterium]